MGTLGPSYFVYQRQNDDAFTFVQHLNSSYYEDGSFSTKFSLSGDAFAMEASNRTVVFSQREVAGASRSLCRLMKAIFRFECQEAVQLQHPRLTKYTR